MVVVGGPNGRVVGPLGHIANVKLGALGKSRTAAFFVAKLKRADLDALRELIEAGKVKPVVEERFELAELPTAMRQMGEGHAQGKLVITVGSGV